ncbi:LysR family transcriptional regulator [Novosphingobium sp. ZN18A2]|uniref:LysR family transcriptional regulator n=1 Tax=Novosphingobium sp. ZN18A2 TaxID=3079861 RepID=UPI0030CF2C18
MSIILLRSFVEVYRQGSVSKAAHELGLTQPAVSGHVASLEAMLERKLFTRHARGVKPTVIADELAARVSGAIDTAEGILAEVRARSRTIGGTIHLCGPSDILSDLIIPRLADLVASNLTVQMHPAAGEEIIAMLVEGRSDFGLNVFVPDDPRIDFTVYGSEELVLVAPLRMGEAVRADGLGKALGETPFLAYDLERHLLRTWLDHNRIVLDHAHEALTAPDLRALRNFVMAGLGWTVLPRYMVGHELSEGRLLALDGPHSNPSIEYNLLWPKSALRNPRISKARAMLLGSAGEAPGT